MGLKPEQRDVIRRSLAVARRKGASPRERKALVETLLVESGARDLDYGDRDSEGALQQRPSQGWGPASEPLEKDVEQFLAAARKANKGKGSAGQLAQAVQRSAYPDRYDQRSAEVEGFLKRYGGASGAAAGTESGGSRLKTVTATTPGVDRSEQRQAVKLAYLAQRNRPGSLLALKAGLDENADTPSKTTRHTERVLGQKTSASADGGRDGVRGAHGEIKEMFYNGPGGVNADEGRRVGKGFVSGHTDHVHIAAGPKRIQQIARFAQNMGLTVRELDGFDKVDPVHTAGSFHYRNQAADISGDPRKMAEFTRRIARRFNL